MRPSFLGAAALSAIALTLAGCSQPAAPIAPANSAQGASAPASQAMPSPPPASTLLGDNPAVETPIDRSTVAIHFQRGANCWRYVGTASTFSGKFGAGQRLDVTSTGEQANGDGRSTWYETEKRNIDVAGAGGQLITPDADGYFDIPANGAYQISFDPISMVGAPGEMLVCTR